MEELTSLEFLLQADAGNVIGSIGNLTSLVPDVVDGIEAFNVAFEGASVAWGKVCGYEEHQEAADAWIAQTGASPAEAVHLLNEATLIGPDVGAGEPRRWADSRRGNLR